MVKRSHEEMARERRIIAQQQVEAFNRYRPVGTPVLYWPRTREESGVRSRTRSGAWLLRSSEPVVLVEGYTGGVALTHVRPLVTSPIYRAFDVRYERTVRGRRCVGCDAWLWAVGCTATQNDAYETYYLPWCSDCYEREQSYRLNRSGRTQRLLI